MPKNKSKHKSAKTNKQNTKPVANDKINFMYIGDMVDFRNMFYEIGEKIGLCYDVANVICDFLDGRRKCSYCQEYETFEMGVDECIDCNKCICEPCMYDKKCSYYWRIIYSQNYTSFSVCDKCDDKYPDTDDEESVEMYEKSTIEEYDDYHFKNNSRFIYEDYIADHKEDDTLEIMKKNNRKRRNDIIIKLKQRNLKLRNDSKVCDAYIYGGIDNVKYITDGKITSMDEIVNTMDEMKFYIGHTKYRYFQQYYCDDEAKKLALKKYIDEENNMSIIPQSLR